MKSERYMEFIGAHNSVLGVVDATSAYAEVDMPLPTSGTETMALLLHQVQFFLAGPDPTLDAKESDDEVWLTKSHHASVPSQAASNPDVLAYYFRKLSKNQIAGTSWMWEDGTNIWTFDPAILIARDSCYFGFRVYQKAAIQVTSDIRLGYTLEKVSREAFIAALVS